MEFSRKPVQHYSKNPTNSWKFSSELWFGQNGLNRYGPNSFLSNIYAEQMDAEGLGRKLLLTPSDDPRRAPEKQTWVLGQHLTKC